MSTPATSVAAVAKNPIGTAQKMAVLALGTFLVIGIARRAPVVGPYVDRGVRWALG